MTSRSWYRRSSSEASCREVGRALQSYLDGDVEEGFAAKISDHLEDCRRCGLEAEVYTRIKETLGTNRTDVDADTISRLREFGSSLAEADD